MTSIFHILLGISICSCCFGLLLMIKSFTVTIKKNRSQQISSFVMDSIKIYGLRAFSAIFQLLLYTSIVLFIFTKALKKNFLWDQIAAFFLGGISMSICLFILAGIVPKLIPKILEKSKIYLSNSMSIQFDSVSGLGFISSSILIINALLLLKLTSFKLIIGYSLGIIFASFFTRIAGGLFKTSAEIGNGISQFKNPSLPQQDARNPGHIIQISAHYIHKICGFCSDLLGSYIISFLSMVVFAYAFKSNTTISIETFHNLLNLPLLIIGISLIGSLLGYGFARYRIKRNALQNTLLESLYVALSFCAITTFYCLNSLNFDIPKSIWIGEYSFHPFIAYITGLLGSVIICYTSEILTTYNYPFAKRCAKEIEFGPTIIQSFAMANGLKSNLIYCIYILIICSISYVSAGLFGVCIASVAMLSLTTTIISINSFSPLAQSTYQIALLSSTSTTILNHTKKMQTLGQSTIAIGNIFSSISAIFASIALLLSFIFLKNYELSQLFSVDLFWLIGIVAGAMIPISSTGYLIDAIKNTSKFISYNIKHQFEQIPYLIEGKAHPDVIQCSDKIVRQCMDSLIIPGILITFIPILIGSLFNISTLLAFSIGSIISSISVTFYWNITGELVNNAKEYIDLGKLGGKSSPYYPFSEHSNYLSTIFKDVLNPSLSIIIKSIMIVTIIMMVFLI